MCIGKVEACDQVDIALDSRSKDLGSIPNTVHV